MHHQQRLHRWAGHRGQSPPGSPGLPTAEPAMVGAAAGARPASPLAVVAEVVAGVDPALDPVVIGAAVEQVAASRHKRRRLALALLGDPAMLTDGRATSPAVVQQLVRALLDRGATRLVAARCALNQNQLV